MGDRQHGTLRPDMLRGDQSPATSPGSCPPPARHFTAAIKAVSNIYRPVWVEVKNIPPLTVKPRLSWEIMSGAVPGSGQPPPVESRQDRTSDEADRPCQLPTPLVTVSPQQAVSRRQGTIG